MIPGYYWSPLELASRGCLIRRLWNHRQSLHFRGSQLQAPMPQPDGLATLVCIRVLASEQIVHGDSSGPGCGTKPSAQEAGEGGK